MLIYALIVGVVLYFGYLVWENIQNKKNRQKLKHLIHINGIRGKSSTTRLIDAGLRAGGYKVYCKTTGTLPMTIDTNNEETLIKRRGRANIKEQIKIMRNATNEGAEILVIECMAVVPKLQYIAQHKILYSDIVAITNVRMDHLDEMGGTLEEIAFSLSNVIPSKGNFFTCDERNFSFFEEKCQSMGSIAHLVKESEINYGFDFNENIELALSICESVGVSREVALEGMRSYKRDPFALSVYRLKSDTGAEIIFANGFSINDPDSTEKVLEHLKGYGYVGNKDFVLLINNRGDRAYRMEQHIDLAVKLNPTKVWIVGAYTELMKKQINEKHGAENYAEILDYSDMEAIKSLTKDTFIFAVGNIAKAGNEIMAEIKEMGELIG